MSINTLVDCGHHVIRVTRGMHRPDEYTHLTVLCPSSREDGVYEPAQSLYIGLNPDTRRKLITLLQREVE